MNTNENQARLTEKEEENSSTKAGVHKEDRKIPFKKFLVARQHGVWLDWTSIWVAQSVLSH